MATLARQPFAPLDGARLQTLTSIKNRQNATPAATKRKASELIDDDAENLDPLLSKRPKATDALAPFSKDAFKPSLFLKPKSTSNTPRPRPRANPKSPAPKLATSAPRSAPAGRSPTRGKRPGISRRRAGGFRVDPPSFNVASAVPFSLDAALKGTIPSYAPRSTPTSTPTSAPSDQGEEEGAFLSAPEMKPSWFFDIHEDTPDQELTNLLQHSTCILDISSDEESAARARDDRGKENVPPADDVSQTSRRARRGADEMVVEKERLALKEMDVGEFYGMGCDASSVFVVPADEEDVKGEKTSVSAPEVEKAEVAEAEVAEVEVATEVSLAAEPVKTLEGKEPAATAVLEPMEGTGESFDLWESGSARGDPPSPAPVAEA